MPAKPSWFLRVPDILQELRALSLPLLDRPAIEKLFGIHRRRAQSLMAGFGGFQTGRTCLIDRRQLIAALEALERGDEFQWEQRRKERLSAELLDVRRQLPGRHVTVAVSAAASDRRLAELPAGVHLQPGELRIQFSGTQDLLQKLYELSQGILNDWKGFEAWVTN